MASRLPVTSLDDDVMNLQTDEITEIYRDDSIYGFSIK